MPTNKQSTHSLTRQLVNMDKYHYMCSCVDITSDNWVVVTAVFTLEAVAITWCNFIGFLFFLSPHERLKQIVSEC